MSEGFPSISVVICAYTEARWDDLVAAVHSVQRQRYSPHEILVIIDHNLALLERAMTALEGVRVVENHNARGLSGARNSGILAAFGEVIAFLDEDAVASEDWLFHLAATYAEPTVLGAGGAILPEWLASQPAWFPEEFNWVVGCTYLGMPEETTSVRNLIGCNMSFRRALFDQVGSFREGIGRIGTHPVGCEETEFCIRVLQRWPAGEFRYEPLARVRHRVPASRATWKYFLSRCFFEGLSKAQVTRWVGREDGLATEWRYTLRTLPMGVLRGLADLLLRQELGGAGRSAAIVVGFLATTAGYLWGSTRQEVAVGTAVPAQ